MPGREVIERQQRILVAFRPLGGLRIFRAIRRDEDLERFFRQLQGWRHPDLLQIGLGLALQRFRQDVEDVRHFVHPGAVEKALAF